MSTLKIKTKSSKKKNEREKLKGYTCNCCKGFYDALNLSKKDVEYLIQIGSRHRAPSTPPKTPPKFWDLNFNDEMNGINRNKKRLKK